MNATSTVPNATPLPSSVFHSGITNDIASRKVGIFSSVFPSPSSPPPSPLLFFPLFYCGADCLCFRNGAFSGGRALIYFGNEGVTTRWTRGAAVRFYRYVLGAILHLPFLQQSSPTFSLFTRGIPPLLGSFSFFSLLLSPSPFFNPPSLTVPSPSLSLLSPSSPFSFLRFLHSMNARFSSCSLEHRANYFLSGFTES